MISRERLQKGNDKAKKRVSSFKRGMELFSSPEEIKKWEDRHLKLHRKTTKLCSCAMCGNPRRKAWKGDKRTMQEKKFDYSEREGE